MKKILIDMMDMDYENNLVDAASDIVNQYLESPDEIERGCTTCSGAIIDLDDFGYEFPSDPIEQAVVLTALYDAVFEELDNREDAYEDMRCKDEDAEEREEPGDIVEPEEEPEEDDEEARIWIDGNKLYVIIED